MGGRGSNSNISSGLTPQQEKIINSIIKRTRNLKNEQYRIVTADGRVAVTSKGGKHEVRTTIGDKRDNLSQGISIHNHPNGGSFSPDDLNDFGYGARQIMAVTPEGVYTLTNTRRDRHDWSTGWYDMQTAMANDSTLRERSMLSLRNEASQLPKAVRLQKEIDAIGQRWAAASAAGASRDELNNIANKANEKISERSKFIQREMRRLETRPFDEFYRRNAKRYGFAYSFRPHK